MVIALKTEKSLRTKITKLEGVTKLKGEAAKLADLKDNASNQYVIGFEQAIVYVGLIHPVIDVSETLYDKINVDRKIVSVLPKDAGND